MEYANNASPAIEEIDRLSHEEVVRTLDSPALERQLQQVLGSSAFYQEKTAGAGMSGPDAARVENFEHWPFTTKSEVLAEQSSHPPYGRLANSGANPVVRIHMTSGTSGTPLYIALTAADVADNVVSGRRAFICAGLTKQDSVVHCLNYCLWAGGLTDHLSLEAAGAAVIPFGVGHTKRLIETIRHLKLTAISCTPSYLGRLEVVLREDFGLRPRDLGLQKGFFGGEGGLQNTVVRQAIEELWGISAIDANYGMADVLSIFGSECSARQGLHFHGRGLLHVEMIDPETGAALPFKAGQEGELVLTNLTRQAQPVVRFRSGDIIRILADAPCSCGRSSFRFLVVGRSDHMIVVQGINVYATAIKALLLRHRDRFSGEFEIVLETPPPISMPLVRAELSAQASVDDAADHEKFLAKTCHEQLQFTPKVKMLPFGALPRTEGKTQYVRRTYEQGR